MSETLKTYKPYLLIEQDENVLQSKSVEIVQKIDDFLRALGYQKFLINKSGTLVKVNYLTSKEYTNYFYKV
jgi:hypothetical protein